MDNQERIAALNRAAQAESQAQADNLVIDFDNALKEWKGKGAPHKVKFLGRTFDVPREKPFAYALFVSRHCIKKVDGKTMFVVDDDKVEEFYRLMFGDEFLEALLESNVDYQFVMDNIVPSILSLWQTPLKKGKNVAGTRG